MGQGVHTVALQVAVEELGIDPDAHPGAGRHHRELGAGQTTGSRGTLMGAGSVAAACRAAEADGCRPGVDYEGEYRVDWTHALGTVETRPSTRRSATPPSWWSWTGRPAPSSGSWPPTTWAGR